MLTRIAVSIAANAAGVWAAAELLGGVAIAGGVWPPLLAGAVLGVVNACVRPVVTILALPLVLMTLGLALLAVNALMVGLAAWLVDDFTVDGFWPAVGAAIVVWLVNAAVDLVVSDRRD